MPGTVLKHFRTWIHLIITIAQRGSIITTPILQAKKMRLCKMCWKAGVNPKENRKWQNDFKTESEMITTEELFWVSMDWTGAKQNSM